MTALRNVEVELPARTTVSSRPLLGALVPVLDGCALVIAVAASRANPVIIAFALVAFLVLNVDSSRSHRLDPRVGQEMGWLLGRMVVPLLGLLTMASLDVLPWLGPVGPVDALVLAGTFGIGLVIFGRAVAYGIGRAARARGSVSEPTLVIGSGPIAVDLVRALDGHPEYGLRPIGFIDGPTGEQNLPLPLLGGPHDLERVVAEFQVRRLVVAFGTASDRDMTALLRQMERLPVEVHVVPRFFELGSHGSADDLRGIPLVHLRRPALRRPSRVAKRGFDIVVATSMLVVTAPLLLLAAVAVRVSSGRPVLFRQTRVGRGGETFQILKFRTMSVHDDPEPSWTLAHHHVTPVGRLLRRTSIDELPQLFNVIRGDMSIVGPRPERPHFVEQFSEAIPGYADRHRVHGGITGLAQVTGRTRGLDSIPERVRLDNAYIESRSLWGDILIMVRTADVALRGDRDA